MKALLPDDPGFIRDMFWSDGMVRATGREYNGLIESPCYQERRPTTPHADLLLVSHDAPDRGRSAAARGMGGRSAGASRGDGGNDACLHCHAQRSAACLQCHDIRAHSHHRADSTGSSCYNCHMPYTTYGLLKTIRSHQISSPSVQATLDTGGPTRATCVISTRRSRGPREYSRTVVSNPEPALDADEQSVAASLLSLLKGDAGQRAIVAQSMGWAPAQQASGTDWMAPYLALMLHDPYDAVRYIATRSRATLPPFRRDALPRNSSELLMNADGTFDAETVNRLVRARDNRRVAYRE